MAKPTIIIGAVGTGTSFALVSRIRANWGDNVRLVGIDIFEPKFVATSLLCDAFYVVPRANTNEYYNRVREIIEGEKASSFIPILNDEITQASRILNSGHIENLDIWNNPKFSFLVDKSRSKLWLESLNIECPYQPSVEELENSDEEWFIKPRNGYGSRGISRLTGREILDNELQDTQIIQEICSGPEITIDSFFDANTGIGMAVCRERIETKAGVCTKARIFFDDVLTDVARRIGMALEQRGTICFQVMIGRRGLVLTDLNLRSGAGTALSCAAGYDVLSAAYACRSGENYTKFLMDGDQSETFVTRQYAEFVTERQ